MICQLCKKTPASIKISHHINNKKIEISLCKECAEEKSLNNPLVTLPQMFGNFISELIGEDAFAERQHNSGLCCEACGTSWEMFQDTGLLGCDICYQTFQADLKVILRRIHGSNQHIGCRPKSLRHIIDESEIKNLNVRLKTAIRREQFEEAAKLRDMIRDAQDTTDYNDNDGILR